MNVPFYFKVLPARFRSFVILLCYEICHSSPTNIRACYASIKHFVKFAMREVEKVLPCQRKHRLANQIAVNSATFCRGAMFSRE